MADLCVWLCVCIHQHQRSQSTPLMATVTCVTSWRPRCLPGGHGSKSWFEPVNTAVSFSVWSQRSKVNTYVWRWVQEDGVITFRIFHSRLWVWVWLCCVESNFILRSRFMNSFRFCSTLYPVATAGIFFIHPLLLWHALSLAIMIPMQQTLFEKR